MYKLYSLCNKNKITFIEGNILILDNLKQLDIYKIYTVIHYAAFKSVNESIKKPLEYYQNNITGLLNLLDLAKAHVAAVKKIGSFDNFEVFNTGTGKGTSVLEIVESFKNNNIKLPYVMKDRRPGDNTVTFCDCEKANKMLEWKAELDINDICLDTFNFAKINN